MENSKKPFILVFGSCGWDRIFCLNEDGSNELIYEEEGRKNSHQAVAAKRAGANSMLISFVGDDELGKAVLKSLNECGIDTRFINVVKGENTEVNHQFIDKITKDYTLKRFPAAISQNYDIEMIEKYKEQILKADYVILVAKQPKEFLTETIKFCYDNNVSTVLTVSHRKFDIENKEDLETLKKCTNIAVNYKEACDLLKEEIIEESLEEVFNILPNLIITNGEKGVWFKDENGNVCHENAVKCKEVVETNGAGDTFIGNFVVFRSEGKSISESVKMSMCASTIEISKMGVYSSMPYRDETECLYREYYSIV